MTRSQFAGWLVVGLAALYMSPTERASVEDCAHVEESVRFTALGTALSGGGLTKYDKVRHADLDTVIQQYWLSRTSNDEAAVRTLFPSLTRIELERAIQREVADWASGDVLVAEPVA